MPLRRLILAAFLVAGWQWQAACSASVTGTASSVRQSKCSLPCSGTCNEELARCDCPRGYHGPSCTLAPEDPAKMCKSFRFSHDRNCSFHLREKNPCVNACNSPRGGCLAGWCRCTAGFYGTDCSLSLGADGKPQLLSGTSYTTRRRRPWIYVYELPPRFNTWINFRAHDRPLQHMFHQRLLSSGARVADGDKADYYFIPVQVRGPSDGKLLVEAVQYINDTWPWWSHNNNGGKHLVVHPGDTGRMGMRRAEQQAVNNCIFITHWGLYKDVEISNWPASHRSGQDIVVPIYIGHLRDFALLKSPLHPKHEHVEGNKEQLQMLFSGRICGGREIPNGSLNAFCSNSNAGYSQGVRQAVYKHHWSRPGFKIDTANPDYVADLGRTRFCLSPTGGGFGHRQILAVFSGCVPLLIGDHVLQPFEPELDWSKFSVSVPQSDIPKLHSILGAITNKQHAHMKAALRCAGEHLTYSSIIGGFQWEDGRYDAFETMLEVLRLRLLHPDAKPHEYASLDESFREFMECRPQSSGNPSVVPNQGPSNPSVVPNQGPSNPSVVSNQAPSNPSVVPNQAPSKPSVLPNQGPSRALCSMSKYDGSAPPCQDCIRSFAHMVPGGAICCSVLNFSGFGIDDSMATCPRPWE